MHKRMSPYDHLCDPLHLLRAWKIVLSNRGAAGSDRVSLAEYARDLDANLELLATHLRDGRYYPFPARKVTLRKPDGGARTLGILTIEDRIVMRAAKDVLEPLFEPSFLDCSFGFRPNRSTAMAVRRALDFRSEGDTWLVHADVENYFDSIDNDLLMRLFSERVRDKRFQWLVRMMLDTGKILPKGGQEPGVYDRMTAWVTESLDGAVSNLLADRGLGYSEPHAAAYYNEDETGDWPDRSDLRRQARKEALKRLGRDGAILALTYSARARKLLSPTGLAVAGATVLAAAAYPAVSRALKERFSVEEDEARLRGIVQGNALSPLLANLYLHPLDVALMRAGMRLVRYADNFIVCCRNEVDARKALELAGRVLADLHLRLNPQKTHIRRFDDATPFEFLGFRFSRIENMAMPISPKNTSPLLRAVAAVKSQAPHMQRLGERATREVKEKVARIRHLISGRNKGGIR